MLEENNLPEGASVSSEKNDLTNIINRCYEQKFNIEGKGQITLDSYGTDNDTFALEDGTAPTGEITRVFLRDGGGGYSLLPSVSVTSTSGTGAVLLADTNDIGAVDEVNIINQGFKYCIGLILYCDLFCPAKFAENIESLVLENKEMNYIDAIVHFCDQNRELSVDPGSLRVRAFIFTPSLPRRRPGAQSR